MVSSTTISSTFSYQKPFRNFPHVFLACYAFRHTAACQKEYNLIMMETMLRTQSHFFVSCCSASAMPPQCGSRAVHGLLLTRHTIHYAVQACPPPLPRSQAGSFTSMHRMSIPAELGSSGYAVVQFLLLGASLIPLIGASRKSTARTYWTLVFLVATALNIQKDQIGIDHLTGISNRLLFDEMLEALPPYATNVRLHPDGSGRFQAHQRHARS